MIIRQTMTNTHYWFDYQFIISKDSIDTGSRFDSKNKMKYNIGIMDYDKVVYNESNDRI